MASNPLDYLGVSDATKTTSGKVELATTTECTTGTNDTKCCTPLGVAAVAIAGAADASEGTKGIAQLATTAEAAAKTNDTKILTPLKAASMLADPGAIGGTTPAAGTFTDLTADGNGTVSLVSNAAALFDTTGAGIDLTLSSDAGRVIVQGDEAAANAVTIASSAGGLDVDVALQMNLASSQNAADAVVIAASAGGIDITATGSAGEDLDLVCTSGSVNISGGENAADAVTIAAGAGGIDISATGAAGEDIDIVNTGGSVNISATEDDSGAILLHANGGTSERILLHSDQGTGVDSVELLSDVGGISLIATGLASADAINLSAPAGGVDIDGALAVNIASSQNAASAMSIIASAGGIDILASGASAGEDIDIIATGSSVNVSSTEDVAACIFLHADAGTSETIRLHADQGTGVASIDLLSDVGGITLTSGLASADAINLSASAGGVDVDGALQVNIASSQNAADAVRINASAGGIDIDAAGAAGEDIDIANAAGSLNLSAGEAIANSIVVSSTNGGIDISAVGAGAGLDIDIVNTGGSVNIQATEAIGSAIVLNASNAAGGIEMTAGTGNITMSGTVENLDAKYVKPTGIDYTFDANPTMTTAADTGGAATGSTGDVNLMAFPEFTMEQFILGAGQTIISPRMGTAGLDISLDEADNEGAEYNFGAARLNSPYAFTIATDAAFQMVCTFDVEDVSGCEPLLMGFRKVEANNATMTSYTDYAAIGLDNVAFAGVAVISTELNSGGTTNTSTTDAWADTAAHSLSVLVSAAGVVTYEFDGGAPSATAAFTFDTGDVVVPFIHFLHGSDLAGAVDLTSLQVGFQ